MTALETLKIRLGISDEKQDGLLAVLLDSAEDTILDVIGRDEMPARLISVQTELAVIAYNRQGAEGETARSEGGISRSFVSDLPPDMQKRLQNYPRKVDTRTLAVYRKVSKKSDYVGTVSELKQVATISAVVKPVTDSVSVEMYGERIHGMLTIATTDKDTLKVGDIVRCDGADYKILSVAHYTMHDSATAERT